MVKGSPEFREIYTAGPIRRCTKPGFFFADPYCEVGYLHRINDYIFEVSIPVVSFGCKKCIGAITVPWLKEAPNFGKSALSEVYGAA